MSYQVIARKYRPQRFSDVVGQEHVSQTLANAINANRIAHAYLFCGPRGTGKTTMARIFAKCLNCTGGPKAEFDDNDPKCREITEGRSLDVLEIDGASNRGIEEIRELRETVKYAPASSKYKIYIIDEVHMLTKEAFNALLKTLEEPPAHVKFMFATTEPEKVLPTILSRCQRFDLRRIPSALIVKHLTHIAAQENVQIDDAALYAIARGADGGMRDAESTLDQLISFCGEKIEESDVLSMFGLAARSQILDLAGSILAGQIEPALRELNDLAKKGKDLGRLLSDLLNHFRNLLIYQVSSGDLNLLEVSEAEAASLKTQSTSVGTDGLTRIMEVLTDSEGRLRDAASKKILLEVAVMKAIQARNATSIDSVLKHLQQLRSEAGSGNGLPAAVPASPAPAARPVEATATPTASAFSALRETVVSERPTSKPAAATPAPAPKPVPEVSKAAPVQSSPAPQLSREGLEELWSKVVEAVGRVSNFTRAYLNEAHPVSFEKKVLLIGFDPEYKEHLGLVDNSKNHALLQTKLSELGYHESMVKFVVAEEPEDRVRAVPAPTPAPSAAPAQSGSNSTPAAEPAKKQRAPEMMNKDEFKNDPLIKKALEIFKGQIVDVRA